MPFHINILPNGTPLPDKGKEFMLIQMAKAHLINPPAEFMPDLVCIIHDEDKETETAVYCFSEGEMNFHLANNNTDERKVWMVVPDAMALVSKNEKATG